MEALGSGDPYVDPEDAQNGSPTYLPTTTNANSQNPSMAGWDGSMWHCVSQS